MLDFLQSGKNTDFSTRASRSGKTALIHTPLVHKPLVKNQMLARLYKKLSSIYSQICYIVSLKAMYSDCK
jgi:hypothetical protein